MLKSFFQVFFFQLRMSEKTATLKKPKTIDKKLRRRERKTQSVDVAQDIVRELQESATTPEFSFLKERPEKKKKKKSDNSEGSEYDSPRKKREPYRNVSNFDGFYEEDSQIQTYLSDPIQLEDGSMRQKISSMYQRYEKAKKDLIYLDTERRFLEEEVNEAKGSIKVMEKRLQEAESQYEALSIEYKNVKELLTAIEKGSLKLVQDTAVLDSKIQVLQRQASQSLFKRILILLITIIIYILVSPACLFTLIYDVVVNSKSEGQGAKSEYFKKTTKWAKKQNKKLEAFLDNFEDKIMNRKKD